VPSQHQADGREAKEDEGCEDEVFQSLANLRRRLNQAIDRSTIQRLGSVTKPFA
jgi:hypothetical protein